MREQTKETPPRREFFLPKWRGVQWTWKRWALVALSLLPLIDSFVLPLSRWADARGEGILFLILGFRAAARAAPSLVVVVACASLVALSAAIGHGIVREVSPFWTPIALGLLIFIVSTWRKGAPPDSPHQ